MIGKNTRRVGLYKGLLQRAAKNKITEFLNFLDKHNTDIAIITETCLTPTDKIRIRNYNIHKKNGPSQLLINLEEAYQSQFTKISQLKMHRNISPQT